MKKPLLFTTLLFMILTCSAQQWSPVPSTYVDKIDWKMPPDSVVKYHSLGMLMWSEPDPQGPLPLPNNNYYATITVWCATCMVSEYVQIGDDPDFYQIMQYSGRWVQRHVCEPIVVFGHSGLDR